MVNPTWDISEVYKREDFDSLKYVEIFRDTAYTFPVTNYNTNILSHDISLRTGKLLEVFRNQAGTSSILPGSGIHRRKKGYAQAGENRLQTV